jgi:dTDP-glucose 4,6-dehydratase
MMAEPRETVLITGGAGFIGSSLVRQWLAHETAAIVNLDRLTYAGLRESLDEIADHPRHDLVEGDVADARLVRELLAEHRPRAVLHLAAESHVDRSIDAPAEFARTNVLGACTLLDEATRYWQELDPRARAAFRFLLVSTDEVFGAAAPGEKFSADSPLEPNSPYAASKAAAEHLARSFAHTYGLPVVTVNPTNNYGPRQMPEKLIPRMILAAARREPLPVYGDGLQERDWLHVEDGCRAIRAALAHGAPGRRYLAGAENGLPNLRLVERLCDLVDQRLADGGGRRALVAHVTDRLGHDRRYAVDSRPLRNELEWAPQVDLTTGLRDVVNWNLDNSAWVAAAEASLRRRDGQPLRD